jgi:hypothetical protein
LLQAPFWIPALLFSLWILGAWLAMRRLEELPELPGADAGASLPRVTLCIPARNEAAAVGQALDAWLAQDAPGLRIVLVDDGSTDATAACLAPRAAAHPERLKVLRNDTLPPGWLGKNHALHLASRQEEALAAEWLLFSDADVLAAPDLLRRAFAFGEQHPFDLLALLPAVDTVSLTERVFLPLATLGFLWAVPFRQVPRPGHRAHCGVGAFTLVRREAYDAVRGHAGAPMEAIDDMSLARRVKAAGFVNRIAQGGPGLHLRMYRGLADLVVGMRKNALALPWLFPLAPLALAVALGLGLSPLLLALTGWPWAGFGLWLLVPPVMAQAHQRLTHEPADLAWAFWPLNALLVAAGLLWAFVDRLRGVNHWRGREVKLPGTRSSLQAR